MLPDTKYRYNINISAEDLGSPELRQYIAKGELLDKGTGKIENFKFALGTIKKNKMADILQDSYITKGNKGYGDNLDLGYVKTIDE